MTDMSLCSHGVPIFERCLKCEGQTAVLPEQTAQARIEDPQVVSTT